MFKVGDKVRCWDSSYSDVLSTSRVYTIERISEKFYHLEDIEGGHYHYRFERVEEKKSELTIGDLAAQSKIKFRNGIEESVWVSFVCALIQSHKDWDDGDGDLNPFEGADKLLEQYRERLDGGKPNAK